VNGGLKSEAGRLLEAGLAELGLSLSGAQREGLLAYQALLAKWNRAYNLTAVREPREMVSRHLLDSLVVVPHLSGTRLIDVGSGAGLPGVPLALACPELTVVLLDSNGKKTRFMTQAAAELGLGNVSVVHSRVEAYAPEPRFDLVISRAFASLADMLRATAHLVAAQGRFLAMKGAYPAAELEALPEGFVFEEAIRLRVPGLDAERHLISLRAGPD
jgi:16S rRNA (guanine527-N7)-methyltransferase